MSSKIVLFCFVFGVLSFPTIASAQCGPAQVACTGAAITIIKNPQAAVNAGVAVVNGANTAIHKAPAAAAATAKGIAALGGPLEKNSTPAYCPNGACYNSAGQRIN